MRVEFSAATKEILAKRAGYRCSFPECRRMTVGPGAGPSDVAITGVAAHIHSASEGGPRGQGGLGEGELKSVANGMWVCETHGKLIDANRGVAYPPDLLISYRDLHEAWMSHEMGGVTHPFGWIHQLTVIDGRVFKSDQRLRLGHVTLISGGNTTGKTALCEWLAGTGEAAVLERWRHAREGDVPLRYEVTYFSPDRHDLEVSVGPDRVRYCLDSYPCPFNPIPFRTVLVEAPTIRRDGETALTYVARHFAGDDASTANLLRHVPELGSGEFEDVDVQRDGRILAIQKGHRSCDFDVLGGGGQMRLVVEAGIVKARTLGRHYPTLLVLDAGMGSIDESGWTHYVRFFAAERSFQTVMVSLLWHTKVDWTGWEVAELRRGTSGTEIRQGAIENGGTDTRRD